MPGEEEPLAEYDVLDGVSDLSGDNPIDLKDLSIIDDDAPIKHKIQLIGFLAF